MAVRAHKACYLDAGRSLCGTWLIGYPRVWRMGPSRRLIRQVDTPHILRNTLLLTRDQHRSLPSSLSCWGEPLTHEAACIVSHSPVREKEKCIPLGMSMDVLCVLRTELSLLLSFQHAALKCGATCSPNRCIERVMWSCGTAGMAMRQIR